MGSEEIVIKIIIWVVGMLIGIGMYYIAKRQIKARCDKIPSLAEAFSPDLLDSKKSLVIWTFAYALSLGLAVYFTDNPVRLILAVIFIVCGISIAAIDMSIRRIPNVFLIILMVASLICNIVECLVYKEDGKIGTTLLSMIVGLIGSFLIFLIPKKFGVYIGNGDIKLSAAIGFALGIVGYIQSMILMSIVMLLYLVILLITKKGGLKTKTPMGPALSFGAIITVIFPILNGTL